MTKAKPAETNTTDAPLPDSNESAAAPASDTEKEIAATSEDVAKALGNAHEEAAARPPVVGLSDAQFDRMMERLTATVRGQLDEFDKRIGHIERLIGVPR
jgi:hypothetical protein